MAEDPAVPSVDPELWLGGECGLATSSSCNASFTPIGIENEVRVQITASVIVCVYTQERLSLIAQALDSIDNQTLKPLQVIVVSDHNTKLLKTLQISFPQFRIVANKYKQGLSGARNTGVEIAESDVVVFLDDDAHAEPDWLERLLAAYQDKNVLGVGGKILPDWEAGKRPSWLPLEFLWVVGCSYQGLPDKKAEVRNPIGANMSFRRSVFSVVGGFDTSVGRTNARSKPLGCEETEFSIRMREMLPGSQVIYEPEAIVHHHVDNVRATWSYFIRRCFAEGYSKAHVSRMAGASAALSAEKGYVAKTLLTAARREIVNAISKGDHSAVARLIASALGLTCTCAGYARALAGSARKSIRIVD